MADPIEFWRYARECPCCPAGERAFRGHAGPRSGEPDAATNGNSRADRAERRGQDHASQCNDRFQAPNEGRVALNGQEINRWPAFRIGRHGLARTFQGVRLFRDLTVLENAELAAVGMGLSRAAARERAWETLDLLGLTGKALQRAADLPYGDERRVGIARALAARPKYLLLDEPAAGMSEEEAAQLAATVTEIRRKFGCGILVIEHNMALIMELCDRIQVLEQGRSIAVGTPPRSRATRTCAAPISAPTTI